MVTMIDVVEENLTKCWRAREAARKLMTQDPTGENAEHYFKMNDEYREANDALDAAIDASYA